MYSENTGSITTFTNATILGANTISSAGKKVAVIANMAGGGTDSVLNVLAVQDGLFFVMVQVGQQHSNVSLILIALISGHAAHYYYYKSSSSTNIRSSNSPFLPRRSPGHGHGTVPVTIDFSTLMRPLPRPHLRVRMGSTRPV